MPDHKKGDRTRFSPGDFIANRFRVKTRLGKGGMAEVYLVEDVETHGSLRALKILLPHLIEDAKSIERFKYELQFTQRLVHKNIVQVFDLGLTEEDEYFFTMEYVEGQTLKQLVETRPPLPEIVRLLLAVGAALRYAHLHKIVHRDVKPANVLIGNDGSIKLTDFGIARSYLTDDGLTTTGARMGTSAYQPPEQLLSGRVDHRADIYSFGIMAHELAAGATPFKSAGGGITAIMHLTNDMPRILDSNPDAPAWFQALVDRCTAKAVTDRFQSMDDVIRYLTLNSEPGHSVAKTFDSVQHVWGASYAHGRSLLIAFLVGLFHLYLLYPLAGLPLSGYVGALIEPRVMDLWFLVRGATGPPEEVIIISVSERSFQLLDVPLALPWPRRLTADLLERLASYGPKSVYLDFLLTDAGDREVDTRLASAIGKAPTFIAALPGAHVIGSRSNADRRNGLFPHPLFEQSAKGLLDVTVIQHSGVVRQFHLPPHRKGDARSLIECIHGEGASLLHLPTSGDYINYYGPPGTLRTIPAHDILRDISGISRDTFRGKHVFVGSVPVIGIERERDVFLTPVQRPMAGVEILGTIAANIIRSEWIRRPDPFWEGVGVLSITTLLSYAVMRTRHPYGFAVLSVVLVTWPIASYVLFIWNWHIPGVLCAFFIAPLVFVLSTMRVAFEMQTLQRVLRGT